MKIEEGYMPFLGYKTYYRIVGTASKDKMPLLLTRWARQHLQLF